MADSFDTDSYAAPTALGERFDFIGWLEDFSLAEPVVWLVRRTRPAVRIGHVGANRYPSGRSHAGNEQYGLWAPAINAPRLVDRAPSDEYGYGTRSAALLAFSYDLQSDSSSAVANLEVRDREIAARLKEAKQLSNPERVLSRGRATLHDLGAWPWAVVEDGLLPSRTPWWADPTFGAALQRWHQGPHGQVASIDPWPAVE
jgi:hypothetical protein